MSTQTSALPGGACRACRRRSWLLGDLSALLDYQRGDPVRLGELLALEDGALIDALAGNRREQLKSALRSLPADRIGGVEGAEALCVHESDWPPVLAGAAPRMFWLSSPRPVFSLLAHSPTVALLGGRNASPYGIEMAAGLARGLAASGVTVVAGLGGELGRAAHAGARDARAGSLAVAGDGLKRIRPAAAARTADAVSRRGCVVSELTCRVNGRGWGLTTAESAVAALGDVAVLIESEISGSVLDIARSAMSSGRPLGAIPGPITSRLSAGPHTLILEGADLIRDAGDVLELLYASRPEEPRRSVSTRPPPNGFDRTVLERVGAGEDTPERLLRGRTNTATVLAALGRLELAGALRRLPDGRYQAREAVPRQTGGG